MSDQSPDLQNSQYVGVGGGILSVNGSIGPNINLIPGTAIFIEPPDIFGNIRINNIGMNTITAGGVVVVENVDFSSPNGTLVIQGVHALIDRVEFDVNTSLFVMGVGIAPAFRQGNISLNAGAGITIVEGPAGTFTFAATVAASVTSVGLAGLPRTGPIVLIPGANVTIVEGPNGSYTFDTGGGAGITSINADAGALQTITGIGCIQVTDSGGGAHTIAATNFGVVSAGVVPSPAGSAPRAGLDPNGWFDRESVGNHSAYPGNNATLFNGVSNFVTGFLTGYAGKVIIVASMQCTHPLAAGAGAYIALTIQVGGVNVKTIQIPVNNFVPPYLEVTWIGNVLANQQVFLNFYNGTGENLNSRGYDIDLVGLLRN